jgi:predicted phosphate transport protein (TIGR00153 family)
MFKRLMPKEQGFFDYFEQNSKLAIEACRELNAIALNPKELVNQTNRIKEIEHKADDVTHKCSDAIHRTFITPIDRSDIHKLMKRLDDIIDAVDSASARMMLYEITDVRVELGQFTDVLIRATTAVDGAVSNLRNLNKGSEIIDKCCSVVYEAETEGDQILRASLARLFKEEKDPILIIKWKDIFERLETATDRCEEAANIIQGIAIEAS